MLEAERCQDVQQRLMRDHLGIDQHAVAIENQKRHPASRGAAKYRPSAPRCRPRCARGAVRGSARRRGRARARRQQEQPVGEPHRLVDVVGHQQRRHRAALDQQRQLVAQPGGERGVERDERLVENEQAPARPQRRARARRGAPGRATARRENARDARSSPSTSNSAASFASSTSGATSRTFSSTVRQGSRRGSWNTMPSVPRRPDDPPSIVRIEARDDPQHRGLAAAGRADERRRPRRGAA